ncbi:MAG TPA: adenylosuccinate lyase [Flavobacteriales bacterium]|nr:adenylosuccinate lyase [Flavobacteriales bacterium]
MLFSSIFAISPVDGRYRGLVKELAHYFSEGALHKYRVLVEIEYFIKLCEDVVNEKFSLTEDQKIQLRAVYNDFNEDDAQAIKETEKVTNHDVKAVEYFVKDKLRKLGLESYSEWIHFGLTSQDINNTAIPLSVKDALSTTIIPQLEELLAIIHQKANEYKHITVLARTHGQPASPTNLGKEFYVFCERLKNQLHQLKQLPIGAKFGGATGNFNAHTAAFKHINWIDFANEFVNKNLGLQRQQFTTQIEHFDNLAALSDVFKRINTILIDFSRDIWMYVMMEYFKQKINPKETGSSAMPHKVNPIDFENAEGNLGVANALFEHFAAKLPISRLQRDLTDSTVLRNLGVPFAHTLISIKSLRKGLDKLMVNEAQIAADLENNWPVIAEGIQTILRSIGYPEPYEALKNLTRQNQKITREVLHKFIDELEVTSNVKTDLKALTPSNYCGVFPAF